MVCLRFAPSCEFLCQVHLLTSAVGYTGVYNVVDYAAVSFPTGLKVDKDIDVESPDYSPLSIDCKAIHETCTSHAVTPLTCALKMVSD